MGGFGSKEWSEVYTNGSPGSPEDQAGKAEDSKGTKGKGVMRGFDPRSISDDVERTPIQVEKARSGLNQEAQETPTGVKNNIDRFKAAIDPRSPSGLPRTPILVQDKPGQTKKDDEDPPVEEAVVAPIRGATKPASPPVAKLNLDDDQEEAAAEDEQEVAETEVKDDELKTEEAAKEVSEDDIPKETEEKEEVASAEPVKDAEEVTEESQEVAEEEVDPVEHVDENKAPSGAEVTPTASRTAAATGVLGLSLPRVMDTSGDSDCRSPLLIDHDVDVFKNKPKLSAKKSPPKKARTPFGKRCDNIMTDEATQMMKDVSLTPSEDSTTQVAAHEDSLVI